MTSQDGQCVDMSASFAFIELKSFGDLVVAAAALRLLGPADHERCRLVIGSHLQHLCKVLAPPCTVEVLSTSDSDVPALFDIKKRGLAAGLQSAFSLRSALVRAAPGMTFVMERQNFRERFIVGGRDCLAIPRNDNIYLAFEVFLQSAFQLHFSASTLDYSRGRRVALCPYSRVRAKNLLPDLICELSYQCEQAGFEPEILLLEGEHLQHPNLPLTRIIPRNFDALAMALAGYAAVISADSLPAHLAEYGLTPTFVVSPFENRYWLPKQAFLREHWGSISDRAELMMRLRRFLEITKS